MDPKSRPAMAAQLVYEDVEPQHRWTPGKDADTLTVDLTGFKGEAEFKKEHLKVKIDNHGNLKVSGERPLGGNRWRRFQKVFHMADDCNAIEIKAKFDNGVLSVTMPKLTKDQKAAVAAAAEQSPAAAQTASATPAATAAVPPVKPATASTKAPEEGKVRAPAPAEDGQRDAARDKKEAEPAADKPAPPRVGRPSPAAPAAEGGRPRWGTGTGTRRRPRWVMAAAVVVAVVVLVGLGFHYWSRRSGVSPGEQLLQQQPQMESLGNYY